MPLPIINIDISSIVDKSLFSTNVIDYITQKVVETATNEIYHKIQELATNTLKSTREQYLKNINIIIGDKTGIITLTDRLSLMVEDGMPAFDLKKGFANSPKAHRIGENLKKFKEGKEMDYTDEGWYITIPFRIGTPETVNEHFGKMPEEIYRISKQLKPYLMQSVNVLEQTTTLHRGTDNLTLDKLQALDNKLKTDHSLPQSRAGIAGTQWATPYIHQSPLYEGMVKITNQYAKTTQNTYMTFRRVSSNSKADSWIHKGIQANKFFDKAMDSTDIDALATQVIVDVFKELKFK